MNPRSDEELVTHLNQLLQRAKASHGRILVELQDDPGAGYELQGVKGGGPMGGITLTYRAGRGPLCETEVSTVGDERVRKTANGLRGLDMDGETIRVHLQRGAG